MPTEELPQIFGFHPNADISKNMSQARSLTELLLQIGEVEGALAKKQDGDEGDLDEGTGLKKLNKMKTIMQTAEKEQTKPEDELLQSIITDIKNNLPAKPVDMDQVMILFPVMRENSMNTVLTQELIRFNRLLSKILQTLDDLQAA